MIILQPKAGLAQQKSVICVVNSQQVNKTNFALVHTVIFNTGRYVNNHYQYRKSKEFKVVADQFRPSYLTARWINPVWWIRTHPLKRLSAMQ